MEKSHDVASRKRRLAALVRADRGALEDALQQITPPPRYDVVKPAETGLVMVRGRIFERAGMRVLLVSAVDLPGARGAGLDNTRGLGGRSNTTPRGTDRTGSGTNSNTNRNANRTR